MNCVTYNTTSANTGCIECSAAYYVSANQCVERVNKAIANCQTYVSNDDKCQTCATGKILSSDGKLCLNRIDKCATHEVFTETKAQADLKCTTCEPLYYLAADQKSCVLGTITNCYKYQDGGSVCSECKDQYVLDNNNTCTK